ncbi:MAG: glycoside hydrolase family 43 protein [Bacteroidota bacterium]
MTRINNPVLRGFYPDPSMIRVGEDYYIATSTFEWFPGISLHHSRDLVHWELLEYPLNRPSQLDMLGNPDSCGVWAPCLTYANETYYLCYTNVRSFDGVWKDTPNFLVTASDIRGPWSEPVFLHARGFDPSLFHDEDGRKWVSSMLVDHRKGKFFGGIILQEWDEVTQKMTGPVHHIFAGSELGLTEGPHLFKRNGWYYLILAEGGTEYGHAWSLARSRRITGPYELHPDNPVISSRDYPDHPLQKAGHGNLVETPTGAWYATALVGRPLSKHGRCITGRETALIPVKWEADEWLYTQHGEKYPPLSFQVEEPAVPTMVNQASWRADFTSPKLALKFQSLRVPMSEDWVSLKARPGYLRLFGRESLTSFHRQSLIATRITEVHLQAETSLEFAPEDFQQLAGLVAYYNTGHYYYAYLSDGEEEGMNEISLLACDNFESKEVLEVPLLIPQGQKVYLRLTLDRADLQFYYRLEDTAWHTLGPILDGSILSDDYVREGSARYRPAFTGAFVGICCQDLTGNQGYADFEYFAYEVLTNKTSK